MDVMNLDTGGCETAIRLLVVQQRQYDCDGTACAVQAVPGMHVVWAGTLVGEGLSVCERERVDVAVLDAVFPGRWASDRAAALVDSGRVRGVMLLDEKPDQGRQSLYAAKRGFAYFTRQATFAQVCDGIRQLAAGQPATDPNLRSWVFDEAHTQQSVPIAKVALKSLTPRETEVMRLVATGNTVKDCARILKLAQSTVDNHKSRLMRKLNVHKSSELTRLAIREGLIMA